MFPTHTPSPLQFRRIRLDGSLVVFEAFGSGASAACPSCGTVSQRRHDQYRRRPMDLPWRGFVVRLEVNVRRFCCPNRACPRVTFAEEFGESLPRRAQRTADVDHVLLEVAQATGGRAGARLAQTAGLPVSRDTLVRLLRAGEDGAPVPTPRVLGVDDLALRRGRTYATLLVDMDTHDPIDLLEGREAQTLATWLREHPGVEVIVRDRAGAYAEGAAQGAPDAIQVADRFHLVKNVNDALDDLVRQRRWTAPAESEPAEAEVTPTPPAPPSSGVPDPPLPPLSATKPREAESRAARLARWERVRALRAQGQSIRQVARDLGLHRRTVRGLLASAEPPHNQRTHPRPGGLTSPLLQPFTEHLQARWQAGCTNATQLYRELVPRGYRGSRTLLLEAVRAWRPPRPPKVLRSRRGQRHLDQRKRRWLVIRSPERLSPEEQAALAQVLAQDPVLATGHALVQRFRALLKSGEVALLGTWLADARASGLPSFVALANGICADRAAVDAAITSTWSTGMVEGHVNRVKLLKRLAYGRAKFDLLRRRVLAA